MEALRENPAFGIYALCAAILGVKMLASAFYTGSRRQKTNGYINPEDAQRFGGEGVVAKPEEAPEVARALRIQRNDLENIPLFLAIGLIYVLSGASATGVMILCGLFTVARVVHTFVYAKGIQPARAICFGIGALCTLVMIFRIIVNVM
ncbi:MAG: MAPEG family protein [Deltaproteobacteria bacterium]|nr:MAPEG family protein [Deltaproteobacteria bacterium]